MKNWQKYWLYFIGTIAILHLIRDVSQDLNIQFFLSTMFVKQNKTNFLANYTWYWWVFNTYVWELNEITIVTWCFKHKYFGIIGYVSIVLFIIEFGAWLNYWILL